MAEAVQMADPPFVSALAAEPAGSAARAGVRCAEHLEEYSHLMVALYPEDAVSR
jgi:hypothetical protein